MRNAKNASALHAQTLVTTKSKELNLVTEFGIAQTVKLTVAFCSGAVLKGHKAAQCDSCDM